MSQLPAASTAVSKWPPDLQRAGRVLWTCLKLVEGIAYGRQLTFYEQGKKRKHNLTWQPFKKNFFGGNCVGENGYHVLSFRKEYFELQVWGQPQLRCSVLARLPRPKPLYSSSLSDSAVNPPHSLPSSPGLQAWEDRNWAGTNLMAEWPHSRETADPNRGLCLHFHPGW